jgi:YfiH family protein
MDPANAHAESLDHSTVRAWQLPGLSHGFMSREGGVSGGAYATFNLADWIDDDPAPVAENWRRWHAAYPGMKPACLNQIHGNQVQILDETYLNSAFPFPSGQGAGEAANGGLQSGPGVRSLTADGIVTRTPGVALCIFTADCVPILLVDPINRVVAALHAGWRGVLADIAAVGVRAMVAQGARPELIRAALGPSIGICCFEVDNDLAERFVAEVPGSDRHTRPGRSGKAYLDLRAIVQNQLMNAGVDASQIISIGPCTKCANDRYFSRRASGGAISGLQMSFIGFKA